MHSGSLISLFDNLTPALPPSYRGVFLSGRAQRSNLLELAEPLTACHISPQNAQADARREMGQDGKGSPSHRDAHA